MKKVLILGKGRMGRAIAHYFKKFKLPIRIKFLLKEKEIKNSSILIGALPSEIGELGLKLALKFRKDLIDISDVDFPFYLKHKKEIFKKGISVFPEWGFSPGITNLICGREARKNKIKKLEILAGTLSPQEFFFPFTWCFEDLVEVHKLKATLIKMGKRKRLPPFSDYKKERIEGIEGESYLAEGLCSLIENLKVRDMSYRILRPLGFFYFFKYLESYGFLKKRSFQHIKSILEKKKNDNLTLAYIKIMTSKKKILWKIKSFSSKNEKLNSMQKITAIFPVILLKFLLKKDFPKGKIFFPENIGKDESLFRYFLKELKKEIFITRLEKRNP